MANYDRTIDGKKFVEFQFWLIFTNSAQGPRVTVRDPSLKRDERAMSMSVLLPVALWETPHLRANVIARSAGDPVTIDTEVVASAIRQVVGADVVVQVLDPEANAAL